MVTPFELAVRLLDQLQKLGTPLIGSFAWSHERVVLDYFDEDGVVRHIVVLPGEDAEESAPFISRALKP
jgi:hypothetical protein